MDFKEFVQQMQQQPTQPQVGQPQNNMQDIQAALSKAMQSKGNAQAAVKTVLQQKMANKNMTPQQIADLAKMADQINGVAQQ